MKSRVNRRLQKLARWGDKPVDDRQPAEMRMMLRSGIQPQFRPSYGSVMTGSATSQPLGTGSAFMSSRSQSTQNLTAAVSNSNSRSSAILHSATAAAALTAPSTLPNRSLSLNENKDGNLLNREGLSSSSSSTIAITQALPAFSNLHEQSEIFGLNPSPSGSSSSSSSKGTSSEAPINKVSAAPSDEKCSTNGKVMSMGMMGTMGGGMSMGGMSSTGGAKIDIDAIRALQMQSVKELSDALKGHDQGGSK